MDNQRSKNKNTVTYTKMRTASAAPKAKPRVVEEFFDDEEDYDEEPVKAKAAAPKGKAQSSSAVKSTGKSSSKPAAAAKKSQTPSKAKAEPVYYSDDDEQYSCSDNNPKKSQSISPTSIGVTSISSAYKEHYETFAEDSQESSDEDDYEGENTPERAERALIKTIKRFATYVSSITADLEKTEAEEQAALRKKGKVVPKSIWADSTFKIDFTKGLLLKVFKPERLMKYYIVFLLPMRKWLEGRKEEFFLKAKVFPGAPEEDIKFFRNLWSIDGTLSREEKDTIWEYWDTQIEIVDDWQAMTGWVVNPDENLNIPDIDYDKAAQEAGIH
jgi:hypothetical protein